MSVFRRSGTAMRALISATTVGVAVSTMVTVVTANAASASPISLASAPSASSSQAQPSPSSLSRDGSGPGDGGLVFVNTNNPSANAVAVYKAMSNGGLEYLASYPTGGKGGIASGAAADKLASQGSIIFDSEGSLVIAANAGTDTISVFTLRGEHLVLAEVLQSGGEFPTSVAAARNLVYVMNAGGNGSLAGFSVSNHGLVPLPSGPVSLGLGNTDPPNFLMAPGQVVFSPDGSELLVTTKASTNDILSYDVESDGELWAAPVATPATTPVPFALAFSGDHQLVSAEAGNSALSTYAAEANGQLKSESFLTDGQKALCWLALAHNNAYVANAGSGTISGYQLGSGGQLSLIGGTGVVGTPGAGAIDLTVLPGDHLLYVEIGGSGGLAGFVINADGTLKSAGSVVVPGGSDLEGIASI